MVQTLFVLYTLLHYLVYVTLYIRIFISVFPYTFGFNHNSITNPKTTIKGTQIKGAKDFTVAQVLYIYVILVQCIYNEKKTIQFSLNLLLLKHESRVYRKCIRLVEIE